MNRHFVCLSLAALGFAALTLAASPDVAAQGAADVAAHKQWMNDASDAQEDYRFAVTDRDQKAAVEALGKLESFMAKTEDYWTAKRAADGIRLAKEARAFAAQAGQSARGGNLTAASAAFDKMGVSCNACHDLHLEQK